MGLTVFKQVKQPIASLPPMMQLVDIIGLKPIKYRFESYSVERRTSEYIAHDGIGIRVGFRNQILQVRILLGEQEGVNAKAASEIPNLAG